MEVKLAVGAMAESIEKQLAYFGIEIKNADFYQEDLDSVTRLLIRGFIPQSVADKARNKIIKEVFRLMRAKVGD